MARKKIVFVIVEGPSDAEALDTIIERLLDKDTVHVHIVHGDLTTENGVTSSNIINRVVDEVRSYTASNPFTKNDFKEIIHIVDTDGAYIPDENVVEESTATRAIYSPAQIKTCNVANIVQRNHQKASNLNKLSSCKEVWSIPYRVFYMSCNLDHALYGKLNCSNEEKGINAHQFAKKYRSDLPGFLSFISTSDFCVMDGYKGSWNFIKEDLHSLERHTNLGLFFQPDPPSEETPQ